MIDLSELKQILHYRMTENEDNYYYVTYWEKVEIPAFTSDIEKTIQFVNSCTGEEFVTLSEIFYEIVEKTKSREFIAALREVAKKFPEECKEYNVIYFIDEAEELLEYLENENQAGLDEN